LFFEYFHFVLITLNFKNMKVEQIYTGCLAHGAYFISSNGEAAVIDPLRDPKPYTERARKDQVQIKYIFETHFHADFVSGHLDLSRATGATIVYGPTAEPNFECTIAKDGQTFQIGAVTITALHTPGHTLESTVYLLQDEQNHDYAIFTGDTLFLGDVGRPDLAQKGNELTQFDLAAMLYDSLHNKIMTLPNDVIVYPGHGAGSACGKNMSIATVDTLGNQKQSNYALLQPNKAAFIQAVTDGLLPPPAYFSQNVGMNKNGYTHFEDVLIQGMQQLSAPAFKQLAETSGALVLDVRPNGEFYKSFIPQSINIGIQGDFAPWVGALIADVNHPILLVTPLGMEEETVSRLSRVGFDHLLGYLEGGFESWQKAGFETDRIHRISSETLLAQMHPKAIMVDVRKETEFELNHLKEAQNLPLANINDWIKEINHEDHFFIHCAGGYRSMIAASILQARGIRNFSEIEGGFGAISKLATAKDWLAK
jgi:hydroxyacylglutathione hydrolase